MTTIMTIKMKNLIFSQVILLLLFSSCIKETNMDNISSSSEPALKANSTLANLMKRVSMNDGSNDNIIDHANCFNLQLPITVIVNGLELFVDSEEDFDVIEAIFDEFDDDDDAIQIIFPVRIILSDYNEILINTQSGLNNFMDDCNGENEPDDDIECLDFQYPITVSVFDTTTEQTDGLKINNDNQLYRFIENLDNDDVVTMNFPVWVVLYDGTKISISSFGELENVIDTNTNVCDEDDDNDYDDDDCIGCSQQQLIDLLIKCSNWTVNKFMLNKKDLRDTYVGFTFNFLNDSTLTVQEGGNTYTGAYIISGTGLDITIIIDIPTFPDFNVQWNLHEIEQSTDNSKIDLRSENKDRLRFESACN